MDNIKHLSQLTGLEIRALSPQQINAWTPAQIQQLTPIQLQTLTSTQLKLMRPELIQAFSPLQRSVFSALQLQAMMIAVFGGELHTPLVETTLATGVGSQVKKSAPKKPRGLGKTLELEPVAPTQKQASPKEELLVVDAMFQTLAALFAASV